MEEATQRTVDTITERPMWINIGLMVFKVRPATLAQIWEVGAAVQQLPEISIPNQKINTVAKMLSMCDSFDICEKVVLILLFRSKFKRTLFRRKVHRCLTMEKYRKIMEYGMQSFEAAFFLTSITFLAGIAETTGPTNTSEATALGASSEE